MGSSLLDGITAADVIANPFPHIVVEDALPAELVQRLLADWPDDAIVCDGHHPHSNHRYSYGAKQIRDDARVAACWQDFAARHTSPAFFRDVVRVFGRSIRSEYPQLGERLDHHLDEVGVGIRHIDDFTQCEVLLDVQLAINTPVTLLPTSVRTAHVDLPNKLFVGLLYLRPEHDRDSRGGDLELCRVRAGARPRYAGSEMVDERCVEVDTIVPYRQNVLVLFLNTARSIHAVTPRFRTPHSRRFVTIHGQVAQPLFRLDPHQASRLQYWVHHYRRQLKAWRSAPVGSSQPPSLHS